MRVLLDRLSKVQLIPKPQETKSSSSKKKLSPLKVNLSEAKELIKAKLQTPQGAEEYFQRIKEKPTTYVDKLLVYGQFYAALEDHIKELDEGSKKTDIEQYKNLLEKLAPEILEVCQLDILQDLHSELNSIYQRHQPIDQNTINWIIECKKAIDAIISMEALNINNSTTKEETDELVLIAKQAFFQSIQGTIHSLEASKFPRSMYVPKQPEQNTVPPTNPALNKDPSDFKDKNPSLVLLASTVATALIGLGSLDTINNLSSTKTQTEKPINQMEQTIKYISTQPNKNLQMPNSSSSILNEVNYLLPPSFHDSLNLDIYRRGLTTLENNSHGF